MGTCDSITEALNSLRFRTLPFQSTLHPFLSYKDQVKTTQNKQIKWYLNFCKEINSFVALCFFLRVQRKIGKEVITVNEVIGRAKKAVRNQGKLLCIF